MSKSKQLIIIYVLIVGLLFALPLTSYCNSQDEQSKGLIDSMATLILKAAWPTAEYQSWSYDKTSTKNNGNKVISFKIYAKSAFTGGQLWLEVKAEFDRDLDLVDLSWGDYKAFLPPGTAFSILKELTKEKKKYDTIFFENSCAEEIRIALRYKNLGGTWTTEGWWIFSPNEKAAIAKTANNYFYYYAETPDSGTRTDADDCYSRVGDSGDTYGFKEVKITSKSWGDWNTKITCD